MVMGQDTAGACGEAFALSDGVCVCLYEYSTPELSLGSFSLSTHTCRNSRQGVTDAHGVSPLKTSQDKLPPTIVMTGAKKESSIENYSAQEFPGHCRLLHLYETQALPSS